MTKNRIQLLDNVFLTYVPAVKFKTDFLSAQFITPLRAESAGLNALLPAALQRGWQATLAELKRQRAVYAALMQSARVVADADGSGVAIEVSKENDFAYSAAQKPDVSTALAAALEHAFGDSVPFRFTQGGGVAAAVMAAAAATGAAHAPAPMRPNRHRA